MKATTQSTKGEIHTAALVLARPLIEIIESLVDTGDLNVLQDLRERWKTYPACQSLLADDLDLENALVEHNTDGLRI